MAAHMCPRKPKYGPCDSTSTHRLLGRGGLELDSTPYERAETRELLTTTIREDLPPSVRWSDRAYGRVWHYARTARLVISSPAIAIASLRQVGDVARGRGRGRGSPFYKVKHPLVWAWTWAWAWLRSNSTDVYVRRGGGETTEDRSEEAEGRRPTRQVRSRVVRFIRRICTDVVLIPSHARQITPPPSHHPNLTSPSTDIDINTLADPAQHVTGTGTTGWVDPIL
ncbi:hypothetical protein BDW22DRAFT_1347107 [Trametopsis cervina]|nr:hypothetical protein BDW22DRAFT_1347107 [Trametopsis cervina]